MNFPADHPWRSAIPLRRRGYRLLLAGVLWAGVSGPGVARDLADAAEDQGTPPPIDLLILRGHAEMNFGGQPPLDSRYQAHLAGQGFRIAEAGEFEKLTPAFLRQFKLVVYLNPSPLFGGGYFDASRWRGGPSLLTARANAVTLRDYIAEGGGVLVVPALEEIGTRTAESLQRWLAPYGLDLACAMPRDPERVWEAAKVGKRVPIYYGWTDRFAAHPVTRGIRRVFYPSYCTRWDDNYTTLPLFPRDPAWIRLVDTAPTAQSVCRRGTLYDPNAPEIALPGYEHPALVVAREFGKGRLAVCGIGPFHLFYLPYSTNGVFAEANFVRIDGIALEKGDGTTPSDLRPLLDNLYRWLAEPAAAQGWGGGLAGGERTTPDPFLGREVTLADRPVREDPMVTGVVRPHRILVGARSAFSGGRGSPAEWARAARAAGIDVVCFTERFESLPREQWPRYVRECEAASSSEVALLPGVDFDTDLGNRFLVIGHTGPFREHLLTADRRRLMWTGHLLIGMGDVLAVAARPQHLATVREHGMLSPELYSHVAGVAVATYDRAGHGVDDGFFAYKALVDNGTHPYPVVVHEVDDPAQLAQATQGLQNIVDSDTAEHAAFFFRQAHARSGGNPDRAYASSGPLVDSFGIDDWQSPCWSVRLRAHGPAPITSVRVLDQRGVFREFKPGEAAIDLAWHGDQGAQEWFTVVIEDAKGGRAILPALRTLPPYHLIRCLDRQNFFAVGLPVMEVSYTGRERSATRGPLAVNLPGLDLPAPLCPKYRFPLFGPQVIVHENVYESTLVPGGRTPEADNDPIFNELPLQGFTAVRRFTTFMSPGKVIEGRLHELEITMRQSFAPTGTVWPVVMRVKPGSRYSILETNGILRTLTLPKTGSVDLPSGSLLGDAVLVTPLRAEGSGAIGFPVENASGVVSGAVFHAEAFTLPPRGGSLVSSPAETLVSLGFGVAAMPWVSLTQGHQGRQAVFLEVNADQHGAFGTVAGTPPAVYRKKPLKIHGVNPRWPVGLWRAGETIQPGTVLDHAAWLSLDTGVAGSFYAGNLLCADNDEVYLAFTAPWRPGEAAPPIEVINPTDRTVTVTVTTPPAISDRPMIHLRVTVPAGQAVVCPVAGATTVKGGAS